MTAHIIQLHFDGTGNFKEGILVWTTGGSTSETKEIVTDVKKILGEDRRVIYIEYEVVEGLTI